MPPAERRTFIAVGLLALVAGTALAGGFAIAGPPPAGPPPTPVGIRASPSPFVGVLRTPSDTLAPPALSAKAAVLADLSSGQVLLARNGDRRQPIASLTKVMTALLVLRRTDPTALVTVSEDAAAPQHSNGLSELGLKAGETISVGDLTYALLLQSSNDAAIALAEKVSGTVSGFVRLMNAEARSLEMRDTLYRSPSGLNDRGYSSALDLVRLTRAAYEVSPRFRQIVTTEFHDVPSPSGEPRHIQNRNVLLWLYPGAIGVKTGYTARAGFCVIAAAERGERQLVAVVLGASSEPFSDAAALLNYGFDAFTQAQLVGPREPVGDVRIRGGSAPVVAGQGLSALIPTAASSDVTRTVDVDATAAYPPQVGQRIATLRVAVAGRTLGSVPLIVASVPPPPPIQPGPWWARAASSVAAAVTGVVHAIVG